MPRDPRLGRLAVPDGGGRNRPGGDRERFGGGVGRRVRRAEAVRVALLDRLAADRRSVGAVLRAVDLGRVEAAAAVDHRVGVGAGRARVGEDRVVALARADRCRRRAGRAAGSDPRRRSSCRRGSVPSVSSIPPRTVSAPLGQAGCPPAPDQPRPLQRPCRSRRRRRSSPSWRCRGRRRRRAGRRRRPRWRRRGPRRGRRRGRRRRRCWEPRRRRREALTPSFPAPSTRASSVSPPVSESPPSPPSRTTEVVSGKPGRDERVVAAQAGEDDRVGGLRNRKRKPAGRRRRRRGRLRRGREKARRPCRCRCSRRSRAAGAAPV